MLLGWSLACADVGPARSGGTCDGDGMFFSTTFTILDEAGNLRLDPTVSYRVDGGPCTEAGCLHLTSDYLCTTWYAGFEEAGTFEITASAAGYATQTQVAVVEVGDITGHVEPVWLDFVLEREPE